MKSTKSIVEFLGVCILAICESAYQFYVNHSIRVQMSSADSLTAADLARDILAGHPLSGWTLPPAPYIFPDTLIAVLVLITGWHGDLSLIAISTINYISLMVASYFIISKSDDSKGLNLFTVAVILTGCIFLVTAAFPASVSAYWQIFGSGTHFGAAVTLITIFAFKNAAYLRRYPYARALLLAALTAAATLSDATTLVALSIWIAANLIAHSIANVQMRQNLPDANSTVTPTQSSSILDSIIFLAGSSAGLLLYSFIPHLSLAGHYLTTNRFTTGLTNYSQWLFSSYRNIAFIVILIVASIMFPFFMGRIAKKSPISSLRLLLTNDFALPSLGLICIAPLLFENQDSLKYIILPAFVLILFLTILYCRLTGFICQKTSWPRAVLTSLAFGCLFCCALINFGIERSKTQSQSSFEKENDCIETSSKRFALLDGVASYAISRPEKFQSNFKRFLTQVSPWAPNEGFFFWGNNSREAIYKDSTSGKLREYNYVIATSAEVKGALWGGILNKASELEQCTEFTIYAFQDTTILWNFLFAQRPFPALANIGDTSLNSCMEESNSCRFAADGHILHTVVGVQEEQLIKAVRRVGPLAYGPFIKLKPGSYHLVAIGKLAGEGPTLGVAEVASLGGKKIIASTNLVQTVGSNDEITALDFEVTESIDGVEFRLSINANVEGSFRGYRLTRILHPT